MEESKAIFKKILEIKEDLESQAYFSLLEFLGDEKEKPLSYTINICEKFEDNPQDTKNIFREWIQNMLNYLGKEKFNDFISKLENQKFEQKGEIFLDIGIIVADLGFFNIAIDLFNKAENLFADKKKKAECIGNIGTVYANQDLHEEAIYYYEKSISIDDSNPAFYANMAASFGYLLDFISARKHIETAINLAKERNFTSSTLLSYDIHKIWYEAFSEHVLNTKKITSKTARDALITAERIFFDYRNKNTLLDASPMVNNYAKALEVILDNCISIHFKLLLKKKYRGGFIKDEEIWKAFGKVRDDKTISLGSWIYIISVFLEKSVKPNFQEFKRVLEGKIDDEDLEKVKEACEFINPLRGPKAHRENITLQEVISFRNNIIFHINQVINLIC